ncbi:HAD hydrolase-like protein [Lacticaseibacillus saniviri]|uniref:HAD hydrolase-like protein n=1 Tax=Lacticaseibacillus saniviri TaxID=931533 RepID=UPI000AEB0706|nr:HAD hydrolase-like protein [Lacticaseibacillus saniviri]
MTHRDKSAWTLLDRDGFADWFLGGVTTELHLKRKPDPEAINYLLMRYQLNPEVTVMVGDRRLDIVAGQNAHVHTAYFTSMD